MKNILILLLLTVFQVFAGKSYSQDTKLTLELEDVTVADVLDAIEDQSEFYFLCNNKLVDVNRKVNINLEDQDINQILAYVFDGTDVDYYVMDRQIVISPKEYLAKAKAQLQQRTITGKVTDQDGNPLVGVTVVIKGTTTGSITDIEGNYEITVPPDIDRLVFSFVGMLSQEISAREMTEINVTLQPDLIGLEEVVVIGYGTQKKVNLTGSVAAIDADDFESQTFTQSSQILTGLVSGVTVLQNSSQPGKDHANLTIRGLGTFSAAGTEPLVLVDGLASSLDDVDPSDIASISVLKDAASASIYGTRGANGVILIETKKGSAGKFLVTYQGSIGFQSPTEIPQIVDSWVYAEMYNEALTNAGGSPQFSAEEIALFKSGEDPDNYPNKRHYDDLITSGSGFQHNHHLSFQGGTARNAYMFSFGYLDQDGIVAETNYKRYNMLLNVSSKLHEKLTLNVKLSGVTGKDTEPTAVDKNPALGVEGLINYSIKIPNTIPGQMSDGYYGNQVGFTIEGWMDSESYRSNNHTNAIANVNLDYDILKSLKLTGRFGYDYNINERELFRPLFVVDPYITQGPAELRIRNSTSSLTTLQAFINYDLELNEHAFHFLGGYSQESFRIDWVEGYRDDFPNNELYELNAGALANQQSSGSASEWALRSLFGRINYNFKGKYLFEANARYDGSSRFPEDNRYGLFPSVSAGWRISEEDFLTASWLDNLKIRVSWGELGNQNIGDYPYQQVLALGLNAPFGVAEKLYPGAAATVVPNKEITWETTRVADIGVDLTVLQGKLSFSADYFDKLTSGILYNVTASKVLGLTPSVQNAGVVSNKGIDMDLVHRNTIGDFYYSIGANFSYGKNQVEELANVEQDINAGLFVGHPLQSIYGYVAEGLFVDQNDVDNYPAQPRTAHPGDIKFKDISGPDGVPDGIVNADYDRQIIGNQFPEYSYGANLAASYKGFDLSIQLRGIAGVDHMIGGYYGNAFHHGSSPQEWMVNERWTTENPNPDAKYPRFLVLGGGEQQYQSSTYIMMNASYLRVNLIQLGYSLPENVVKKLRMSNLRFFTSIRNPITLDNFREGWDPEMLTGYPPVKVFMLGVNVSF